MDSVGYGMGDINFSYDSLQFCNYSYRLLIFGLFPCEILKFDLRIGPIAGIVVDGAIPVKFGTLLPMQYFLCTIAQADHLSGSHIE